MKNSLDVEYYGVWTSVTSQHYGEFVEYQSAQLFYS